MSPPTRPPSPEKQLEFLEKLQRLFAEGDFTATYKFALLISLADLAIELGRDDGATLTLSNRQIAERFVHLYWRHASPYGTGRPEATPGVLVQNIGAQAAVLTAICDFRQRTSAASWQQARALPDSDSLLRRVSATVSAQPLNYLQNFGGGTDPFLYERDGRGGIRLKPGVAYCLRRFYPLVQQISRSRWLEHIKRNRRNHAILGEAGDLEDFLFATSRQSLRLVSGGLRKLDGDRCFYCGRAMREADVDHYIPFSLYPRDLAHNFVLAHPDCNRSKSDSLAGLDHLERWLDRLTSRADDLAEIGLVSGVAADSTTAGRVAAWAYASAHHSGGRAWLEAARYEAISDRHVGLFASTACS